MRITAFTLGSYGDVMPFVFLGKELIKRGYKFRIATYENFKDSVMNENVEYLKISGDSEEMVSILLGNSNNGANEGMNGIRYLLSKYPMLYDEFYDACKDSDLIIYMQFGAPAYHFAEKFGIPVIRSLVFPFELTKQYCSMSESIKRDSLNCLFSNFICRTFMAAAARSDMNAWRKRLGLKKIGIFHDYTKMNNKKLLTLYQYDEILAKKDPRWKKHIYLTGNWIEPVKNAEGMIVEDLDTFCDKKAKVIYIGFGSMNYKHMGDLYSRILKVLLKETDFKVIMPDTIRDKVLDKYGDYSERMKFIGFVPFEILFEKVDAVIHHGGNGTTHAALRSGKPQLIMAFGADQMFWGGQCFYLQIGPEPIDVKKDIIDDAFRQRLIELTGNELFEKNAERYKEYVSNDGVMRAADIIEEYYPAKR